MIPPLRFSAAGRGGKLLACAPASSKNIQGGKMEAYRIDRFGGVDGIVLRWSEDPGPAGPVEPIGQGPSEDYPAIGEW